MDHATNVPLISDSDALASALGAIGAASAGDDAATAHQFGDFTHRASTAGDKVDEDDADDEDVDITGLEDGHACGG